MVICVWPAIEFRQSTGVTIMPPRIIHGIEELRGLVGQEIAVGDWFTVTQDRINAFADVSQDHQWIHTDPERAKGESPFGTTVAHGFLTLSLLSYLHSRAVQINGNVRMSLNYGLNRVRFTSAVKSESRIRTRSVLKELSELPDGVRLTWSITVEIEGSPKPALVAEWLGQLYL
jgi:acyl dehydratase